MTGNAASGLLLPIDAPTLAAWMQRHDGDYYAEMDMRTALRVRFGPFLLAALWTEASRLHDLMGQTDE